MPRQISPPKNGETIIIPPVEELVRAIRANAQLRAHRRFRVLDVDADTFTARARDEALKIGAAWTKYLGGHVDAVNPELVVATGHQPELAHAGVWFKNHLAWHLASAVGAASVNFVVDNDAVDLNFIRVPAVENSTVEVRSIPFIETPRDVAAEEVQIKPGAVDALAWAARFAQTAYGGTMAQQFAGASSPDEHLAEFITLPRMALEREFGFHNIEIPVSGMAEADSFLIYVAWMISRAEEFRSAYNRALDEHRAENSIANPVEPMPNLSEKNGGIETPFWIWRAGEPRRPLVVERANGEVVLWCGRSQAGAIVTGVFGSSADSVRALRELSRAGWKIRPRSLAMTLYFRMFLCDLFIHGLGGANYEPVNDRIIRDFFQCEPPQFAVASATLIPKLIAPLPSQADTTGQRQRIRRMKTTPAQFVRELMPDDRDAAALAEKLEQLRDMSTLPKSERHAAFLESKRLAQELGEKLRPLIEKEEHRLAEMEKQNSLAASIEDRTLPFFLNTRDAIKASYSAAFAPLRASIDT